MSEEALEPTKHYRKLGGQSYSRHYFVRNIEIVGEAMNRILQKDSSIELSNSRKIVDTRNRIIHGYDSVSDDIIWSIIVSQLPALRNEVEKMLQE